MKFENLKPGAVVYDVGTQKMGNTPMKTVAVWKVLVVSVDVEKRCVTARWNHNPPRVYFERQFSKWRETRPELVPKGFGGYRLATAAEKKALKAERDAKAAASISPPESPSEDALDRARTAMAKVHPSPDAVAQMTTAAQQLPEVSVLAGARQATMK